MRAIILGLGVILAAVTATPVAKAQSSDVPQVENARVEKKSLAEPLAAEMKAWATKAEQPQWLGYAVPQMGESGRCAAAIMTARGEMGAGIAGWRIASTERI